MIPPPTGLEPTKGSSKPAFEPAAPVVGYEKPTRRKPREKKPFDPDLEPGSPAIPWVRAVIKDAITYPWRDSGWAIIISGAVLSLLLGIGHFGSGPGYFTVIFSLGYFAALYFDVIARTMNGEDTMPDWPSLSDWKDDISSNANLKLGVAALSYGPLLIYHFACPAQWRSDWCELALFAYGVCYHPMACIRAVLTDGQSSAALLPHKVIPAITRCAPAYFLGVLPFALIALLSLHFDFEAAISSSASHGLIDLFSQQSLVSLLAFALTVGLVTAACSLYMTLVQARITGLIARRYRDEIDFD